MSEFYTKCAYCGAPIEIRRGTQVFIDHVYAKFRKEHAICKERAHQRDTSASNGSEVEGE